MIEVLVALSVAAFAVLGAVRLEIVSAQVTATSRAMSSSAMSAGELADLIEATKSTAGWSVGLAETPVTLSTGTPRQRLLASWLETIAQQLPNGDAAVTCTSAQCVVDVQWQVGVSADVQHAVYVARP